MIHPYYQDSAVTIYHANCVDVFPQLPPIDLTVTSPPYDNLRTYNGYEFDFEAIAQGLYGVTNPGGVVVWVVGDATIDGEETGASFRQALYFKEIGFNLHDTMIWDKQSFRFPDDSRYYSQFEFMFVLSRGRVATFHPIRDRPNKHAGSRVATKSSIRNPNGSMRPNGAFNHDPNRVFAEIGTRGNVWYVPHCTSNLERTGHPAQMNEIIANDHIRSWSNPGDTILDPMCGSGTTLKMARKNGCKAIGIDISEEYCELSVNRLRQEVFNFQCEETATGKPAPESL
jgi:DNA modification methylase